MSGQKLCPDKIILRQTHLCRDKTFVATKMMLVAAPATDKDSAGKPADPRSGVEDSAGCRGMTCFQTKLLTHKRNKSTSANGPPLHNEPFAIFITKGPQKKRKKKKKKERKKERKKKERSSCFNPLPLSVSLRSIIMITSLDHSVSYLLFQPRPLLPFCCCFVLFCFLFCLFVCFCCHFGLCLFCCL